MSFSGRYEWKSSYLKVNHNDSYQLHENNTLYGIFPFALLILVSIF